MTARLAAAVLAACACALSACHSLPPKATPVAAPEPSAPPPPETPPPAAVTNEAPVPDTEAPKAATPDARTCACNDAAPKPVARRKPKPVPPVVQAAPPAAAPVPPLPSEASVKLVENSSASILGKKVQSNDGADLGRVVDVLADAQGRVRMAIIEFGGFLGVGNRRIAVDWSLLKFQPADADAPIVVDASRRKLQATPEFKGTERPVALMAPAAAPASPPPDSLK